MQSTGTYEEMLREFAVSSSMLDGRVRCSENYIFGKGSGGFFAYRDIYWVYQHTVSYFFIPIKAEAMVGDNKGKVASFCKLKLGYAAGSKEMNALAGMIRAKNPQVLLGFVEQSEKEYKRRTR